MAEAAITVEGVSKSYRLGRSGSARGVISQALKGLFASGGSDDDDSLLWALQDVSFQVRAGEVVGVIGRNGAGKSTLLKILSRITAPSAGSAKIRGRVSSLLEVGTGFHPELTGRENVYMNGSILGLSRPEIDQRFEEIVDFSGVERFLDTPLKRYSSGMQVRLAFSVAAHLDPEVLIVDEVLAVGDARFQQRCIGRMRAASDLGRTVLLVSHNMQAVSTLAHRCLVLDAGRVVADAAPREAISTYLQRHATRRGIHEAEPSPDSPRITRVEVITSEPDCVQRNGTALAVEFEVSTPAAVSGAALSFQICDEYDRPVIHLWTFDSERPWCRSGGTFRARCEIPKLRLYMGQYALNVHLSEGSGGRKFETLEGVCPFEVVMLGHPREFEWRPHTCLYLEDCQWSVDG